MGSDPQRSRHQVPWDKQTMGRSRLWAVAVCGGGGGGRLSLRGLIMWKWARAFWLGRHTVTVEKAQGLESEGLGSSSDSATQRFYALAGTTWPSHLRVPLCKPRLWVFSEKGQGRISRATWPSKT